MIARHVCQKFALLLLVPACSLIAQISQASLSGTVQDSTGASVPGATVTIKDKGTSLTRAATTSSSGEYSIPDLTPTDYSLTIAMKGFKSVVVGSLTLHTGDKSTYNATLEVGSSNQEITVDAAVPLLTRISHSPPSQPSE